MDTGDTRQASWNRNRAKAISGLRFAMKMGAAVNADQRVTFGWDTVRTFASGHADVTGEPWSYTEAAATTTTHATVQIDVAITFTPRLQASRDEVGVGDVIPSTIELTVLGEDYPAIATANWVEWNGRRYRIALVSGPEALFDLDVYTVHARHGDVGSGQA